MHTFDELVAFLSAVPQVVLDQCPSQYRLTDNVALQAPGPRHGRLQGNPAASGGSEQRAVASQQRLHTQTTPTRPVKEGVSGATQAAAEFPPALRLYVLFLEAADSFRLNSALMRWAMPPPQEWVCCGSLRFETACFDQEDHLAI